MKLEGIRVIELAQFLPGPHLTMMMADHGAEVIKIEPPGGEPNRNIGVHQAGCSVFFRNTHRGKQSVVLDLKDPLGREALLRLVEKADVLVESFRPGTVKRLGVDYAAVSARNPAIVYCSIAAFGQTGPLAAKPAHDLSIQALSGTLSVNLGADGAPASPGVPGADMAGSMMALAGVLMALLRRQATGEGEYIDISMQDALLSWTANALGTTFGLKQAPQPKQERTWGGAAFYRIYQAGCGGYLTLGGRELKFVRNFLTAQNRMDLYPLVSGEPGSVEDPVKEYLEKLFATRTLEEWTPLLDELDICWAPVLDYRQAYDHPHVRARGMLLNETEEIEHLGNPIQFTHEPGKVHFSVPQLGQHTRQRIGELGFEDAEIEQLLGREK
jgi:crotonobetainyl-CoA:carnitine CoA-transferase CaiB-like acyl-CoA transferase